MRRKENFETLEILLYALSMYSLVYNSLHYGCILTYIKYICYICSLMLWEYKSYDDIKVHDMKKHILVVKKNETSHQLVSSSITFLFLFLFSHIYFFLCIANIFFSFPSFLCFFISLPQCIMLALPSHHLHHRQLEIYSTLSFFIFFRISGEWG